MYNKNNLEECQNEIKRLKEERKRDYEKLREKYKIAEKNLKNNPKKCGGEEHIKGFMSGLISGMVLLNDNLQSKIIDLENNKEEIKYNNLAPITPNNCLICGSRYIGGPTWRGEPMKEGLKVYFKCGSMLFRKLEEETFQLFINCYKQTEIEHNNEQKQKNKSC